VSQNGLGISTAKAFAIHHPALLILAARSQAALDAAVSTIKEAVPDCPTRVLNLDLGSFRTVRAAAAEVNCWHDVPKIDILINNAAAAAEMSWKLSEDGIEHHFATNHVGPFLFTNLIVGKVIAAKGRVVNVSSVGHVSSGIRFDDPNFKVSQSLSREILETDLK
jgi:NAD(P)-dependent dehydrogenase (short-subunit alcohol dehydrogenase family)